MPIKGAERVEPSAKKPRTTGGIPGARIADPPAAGSATFGERAGAVGTGITSGLIETTPIAGAAAGFTAGVPFGPPGMAVGTALGLLGGEYVRRTYRDLFGVPRPQDLQEDLRPFAFAGEVVGASAPIAAAPFAAAARGAQAGSGRAGSFVQGIIEYAARRPRMAASMEASGTAAAAVGEGVAEEVAPGETGTRLAAGTAAGLLSPARLAVVAGGAAMDGLRRAASSLSRDARETRAGQIIAQILRDAGEDPEQVAKALAREDLPRLGRTSAQFTGSPALQALEAKLTRESAKFGEESRKRAEESLRMIRRTIGLLEATGDPNALKEAARLRDRYFKTLIRGRIDEAERKALEAAQSISEDTPRARAELSKRLTEIVDNSLSDAREVERRLWGTVPQNTSAQADNIMGEANRIAAEELLPTENLPKNVEDFTKLLTKRKGDTSVRELLIFRRRMLEKAREADKNSQAAEARFFGLMAEAALDDLAAVDIPEIKTARDFSFALNEVFTRTFAGETQATVRTGARRIPPELVAQRTVQSGREGAALRFSQLERAVEFGSPDALNEMLDIQQRLIRLAASEIVDPGTGQVSADRLARFARQNEAMLERFPEVRRILQDSESAKRYFDRTTLRGTQATKTIDQRAAFARVANAENTTREVGRVLDGENPVREFTQLARLAKRDGEQAVAGLRRAVFDQAFERAGGQGERFSFSALRRAFFQGRRPGQPSIIDLMRREGVIDKPTVRRLEVLLDEAEKVEATIRARPALQEIVGESEAIFDFVLRATGAQASSLSPTGQFTGAPLVVAGAGSRTMRHIFDKIPTNKVRDVIMEAAENPRFMAALLRKPASQKEKIRLARTINAWLLQAGLVRGPQAAERGELQLPMGP